MRGGDGDRKRARAAGAIAAWRSWWGPLSAVGRSRRRRRRRSRASAAAAPAPAPAVPTFVNGMAQAVFASGTANYVNHELWVEIDADTDFDGKKDRVHADVSRPRETDTDGLKVPVIFEDSPYYAGGADVTNWAVDHELGAPPASAHPRARLQRGQHQPDDQHDLRVDVGAARLRRRALRVARHRQLRRLPELRRADRDARRRPPSSTGSTAARKGYTTRAGTTEVDAYWTTGNVGMMGTSYNGTLPIAAATTGRRGPEGDRPDLGHLATGTTTTAPTA